MRWIIGIVLFAAVPARADIVDGGSLVIGGQGVFGGTVTVNGNALGVAGAVSATSATLSATGAAVYSLTSSSGIHLQNGKLKLEPGAMVEWADGSVSSAAAAPGPFVLLLSTDPSAASSTTIGGLAAGVSYRLEFNIQQVSAAGQMFLRFNSDSGANYRWGRMVYGSSGGAASEGGWGSTMVEVGRNSTALNQYAYGIIEFGSTAANASTVNGVWNATVIQAGSFIDGQVGSLEYVGSAPSSVTLYPSAGAMTGTIRLYRTAP